MPEPQSLVCGAGDDVLAIGAHAHVDDARGVALEATHLLHGLHVPDDRAVQTLAVRGDEVAPVAGEAEVADLSLGPYGVHEGAVVDVPELDRLVLGAATGDEHA